MNPNSYESTTQNAVNHPLSTGNDHINSTSAHPTTGSLTTSGDKATHGITGNHHGTGGLTGLDSTHHTGTNLTGHHNGNNVVNNLTGHHKGSNLTGHHAGNNLTGDHTGVHSATNNLTGHSTGINSTNNNLTGHKNGVHTSNNLAGNHNVDSHGNVVGGLDNKHLGANTVNNINNPASHHVGNDIQGTNTSHIDPSLRESYAVAGDGLAPQVYGLTKGKTNHIATENHHLNDKHHNGTHVNNTTTLGSTNDHHLNTTTHNNHNGNHVVGQNTHPTHPTTGTSTIPPGVKPSKVGGTLDKMKGSVQESLGKAMNNPDMIETGIENKLEGKAKIEAAKLEKEKQHALH